MNEFESMLFILMGIFVAYGLGFYDGYRRRPPPPSRGTYEHIDDDDKGNYDIG